MSTQARTPLATVPTLRNRVPTHRRLRARPVPQLLRDGAAAHGTSMVVRALPADGEHVQRAVVASRKVGGAVDRNRAKRRLREAIRAAGVPAELDLVVIARAAALSTPLPQLTAELQDLIGRLRAKLDGAAGSPQ